MAQWEAAPWEGAEAVRARGPREFMGEGDGGWASREGAAGICGCSGPRGLVDRVIEHKVTGRGDRALLDTKPWPRQIGREQILERYRRASLNMSGLRGGKTASGLK